MQNLFPHKFCIPENFSFFSWGKIFIFIKIAFFNKLIGKLENFYKILYSSTCLNTILLHWFRIGEFYIFYELTKPLIIVGNSFNMEKLYFIFIHLKWFHKIQQRLKILNFKSFDWIVFLSSCNRKDNRKNYN